jgi:hypothetical protein
MEENWEDLCHLKTIFQRVPQQLKQLQDSIEANHNLQCHMKSWLYKDQYRFQEDSQVSLIMDSLTMYLTIEKTIAVIKVLIFTLRKY